MSDTTYRLLEIGLTFAVLIVTFGALSVAHKVLNSGTDDQEFIYRDWADRQDRNVRSGHE
jgi:hypothetical protein